MPTNPPTKQYLGDRVYITESDYDELVLTTEDGIQADNVVFLEPYVVKSLMEYLSHWLATRS